MFTEVEYAVVISPRLSNDPPEIIQPDTLYGYHVCDTVIYEFSGADPDSDAILDSASLSIEPPCGTYSVQRITGSGSPSGTWEVTWITTGCQDSITYLIIVDLTDDQGNTSYCTTYCHLDRNNPPVIEQPDFIEGYVDSVVEYEITGTDPDGDIILDTASIDIQPGCGAGSWYSITRILGHGSSSGTWEITWYTGGCTPCDTHMVIHDLTDGCDTSYCTTYVHLSAPESLYWKPSYDDYAPNGMVDIDQKQDNWVNFSTGAFTFCGPVALANCWKWFDSKYNVPPGAPGDGWDRFPLVRDYLDNLPPFVGLDDHDPWNVDHVQTTPAANPIPWPAPPIPILPQPFVPGNQNPPLPNLAWGELVERLAWFMDTDGSRSGIFKQGTNVFDMQNAIDEWFQNEIFSDGSTLADSLYERTLQKPTFAEVETLWIPII